MIPPLIQVIQFNALLTPKLFLFGEWTDGVPVGHEMLSTKGSELRLDRFYIRKAFLEGLVSVLKYY